MRLAKLALMADEDEEVGRRKERRKSRRESSVADMPGASFDPLSTSVFIVVSKSPLFEKRAHP